MLGASVLLFAKTVIQNLVSTYAGTGSTGSTDGASNVARFQIPVGITVDSSGNLYIADSYNHKIRKISTDGTVSTYAGTGSTGSTDGASNVATFNVPIDITIDSSGNLYVSDSYNNKIRKIATDGTVSTYAGTGTVGSIDGASNLARFYRPQGIISDLSGNLYVADTSNYKIRKIATDRTVSTIAGTGSTGSTDGAGNVAKFNQPYNVTIDSFGNLFVADSYNHKIRKISTDGTVSTIAGTGVVGSTDGALNLAKFNYPQGITIDSSGNLYVADTTNNKIRKIVLLVV